jgi:diaminohydroxyphosphoribosylaminopyrimidine deaminase/5-amino-6-(5-phosphoribosylamino)uracil reductase
MPSLLDQSFMRRALDLAVKGRGLVEPNPLVGCIIARDGIILGEGFHERFGQAHAERKALAACTESARGATAYVTLEPCCHTDKKTPPCVPALIEAGIARVVVACVDPNPAVAGKGIEELRGAGIDVECGLCEADAKQLNAPFFARMVRSRPYVTLKWAQTVDGKVAGPGGRRLQITGAAATALVLRLRARCDAILIGIGTALADDPLLTARGVENPRPLIRAVMDTHLRLPLSSQLVRTAREHPLVVYCGETTFSGERQRVAALQALGVEVVPIAIGRLGRLAPIYVLQHLYSRNVTHLLIEGGPTVAQLFIDYGLVDRVWTFHSPIRVDSADAPDALVAPYSISGQMQIGPDRLVEQLNEFSDVFFALAPSADFILG